MQEAYSTPGMKTFVQKRMETSPALKGPNAAPGNTMSIKTLPVQEHLQAASDHMSAARMVQDHDHESAADHLQKAAIHNMAAGQHFETHSKMWIQKAVAHAHGQFAAKAKAAHKSTAGFASKVLAKGSKASTHTKKQASLAKTLAKVRPH
jgi:hypothetical protein